MQPKTAEEGVVVGVQDTLHAAPLDRRSEVVGLLLGVRGRRVAVHGCADPGGRCHVQLPLEGKGKPADSGQPFNCLLLPGLPFSGPDEAPSHLNDTQ
eukprot:3690013-Heterocapsa_arctica.AAC.2